MKSFFYSVDLKYGESHTFSYLEESSYLPGCSCHLFHSVGSRNWGGNWIKTLLMQGNVDITECLNGNGAAPQKHMMFNVNHDQLFKVNNVNL
jgi:hypothetical protein